LRAQESLSAEYDHLLDTHAYGPLALKLKASMETPASVMPTLAWEQQRFAAGSPVFVGAMYALDLLAVARRTRDEPTARQMRESAVMVAFYDVAAIETDGTKCADPDALKARQRQFAQILAPIWVEVRKLPDEAVSASLARALTEEGMRSGRRAPDDYLCRGRTDDIPDAIADGAQERPPRFLTPQEWVPKAAAARAGLPDGMTAFAARLKRGSAGE
jgi:hypothetical protein